VTLVGSAGRACAKCSRCVKGSHEDGSSSSDVNQGRYQYSFSACRRKLDTMLTAAQTVLSNFLPVYAM
jgi:hypothetical protein